MPLIYGPALTHANWRTDAVVNQVFRMANERALAYSNLGLYWPLLRDGNAARSRGTLLALIAGYNQPVDLPVDESQGMAWRQFSGAIESALLSGFMVSRTAGGVYLPPATYWSAGNDTWDYPPLWATAGAALAAATDGAWPGMEWPRIPDGGAKPSAWGDYSDAAYVDGFPQEGDVLGAWWVDAMLRVLDMQEYTAADPTITEPAARIGHGNAATAAAAIAAANADYAAASWVAQPNVYMLSENELGCSEDGLWWNATTYRFRARYAGMAGSGLDGTAYLVMRPGNPYGDTLFDMQGETWTGAGGAAHRMVAAQQAVTSGPVDFGLINDGDDPPPNWPDAGDVTPGGGTRRKGWRDIWLPAVVLDKKAALGLKIKP